MLPFSGCGTWSWPYVDCHLEGDLYLEGTEAQRGRSLERTEDFPILSESVALASVVMSLDSIPRPSETVSLFSPLILSTSLQMWAPTCCFQYICGQAVSSRVTFTALGTSSTSPHTHRTPDPRPPVSAAQTNRIEMLSGSKWICKPTALTYSGFYTLQLTTLLSKTGKEADSGAGPECTVPRVARHGQRPGFGEAVPLRRSRHFPF